MYELLYQALCEQAYPRLWKLLYDLKQKGHRFLNDRLDRPILSSRNTVHHPALSKIPINTYRSVHHIHGPKTYDFNDTREKENDKYLIDMPVSLLKGLPGLNLTINDEKFFFLLYL